MPKSYVFGKDTLQFDNDDDAIKYAEETGASEFKPLDADPLLVNSTDNGQTTLEPITPATNTPDQNSKQEAGMGDPFAAVPSNIARYPLAGITGLAGMVKGAVTPGETALETGNDWLQKGLNNEGWQGVASDPVNLAAFVPGLPELSVLGKGRIAKGIYSAGQGLVEGGGLSAADQYLNNGNVQLAPTLMSGGIGAVTRPVAGFLENEAGKYTAAKAAQKEVNSDPFYGGYKYNDIEQQAEAFQKHKDNVDPTGLYDTYQQSKAWAQVKKPGQDGPSTNWAKPVIQKAKQDIASNSPIPITAKNVTDREAREHIGNVINKVESFNRLPDTKLVAPYKFDLGNLGEDLTGMVGGGYIGHLALGLPGGIAGAIIGGKKTRELAGDAIQKGLIPMVAKAPGLATGLSTVGPVQYSNAISKPNQ